MRRRHHGRWAAALTGLALGIALLLAGSLFAPSPLPTAVLRGRVRAGDGGVPRRARVALLEVPDPATRELRSAVAASGGGFELRIPAGRPCYLLVSAVLHEDALLPVYLAPGETARVEVHLRPVAPLSDPDPEEVYLAGSWLRTEDGQQGVLPMERQEDGTWTWEGEVTPGPDGTIAWRVTGVLERGSATGRPADDYEYRGEEWWTVTRVRGPRVRLVYDPADVPVSARPDLPLVAWDDAHRWLEQTWTFHREERALLARGRQLQWRKQAGRPVPDADLADWRRRWSALAHALEEAARSAFPPPAREWAAALRIAMAFPEGGVPLEEPGSPRGACRRYRPVLGPRSPWWLEIPRWSMDDVIRECLGREDVADFLARLARLDPVRHVRGNAMAQLLARADAARDRAAARRWWRALRAECGEDPSFRGLLEDLDPARPVQVGLPVPPFEATTLDGKKLTDRDLRGKVVLLDFWGTWCGPCIGEMPVLHEAYERFHDRGFEIVGFALGESPETVREFRRGQWKMPWIHVILGRAFGAPIARAFRVDHVPFPVLVGRDGTIVAVEPETRGRSLLAAVEKALEESGED